MSFHNVMGTGKTPEAAQADMLARLLPGWQLVKQTEPHQVGQTFFVCARFEPLAPPAPTKAEEPKK